MGDMTGTFPVDSVVEEEQTVSAKDLAGSARARRAELGLTQEDVRARSGLSVTTIARIENGDPKVSMASLRRYDDAVGWPPGTAESHRRGRGGVVAMPTGVSDGNLSAMVEQLAPLIAEQLRARRGMTTINVAGLSAAVVVALEQLVAVLLEER